MLSLSAMVVAGFGVFFLHARPSCSGASAWSRVFVGPTQSTRAFLPVAHHPRRSRGEVFGLYATTGRAVSFMAPPCTAFLA